jgi:hypothetical protein
LSEVAASLNRPKERNISASVLFLFLSLLLFAFYSFSPVPQFFSVQSRIQWVVGIKRPGREADHWPLPATDVKSFIHPYCWVTSSLYWHKTIFISLSACHINRLLNLLSRLLTIQTDR